ncbi:MAG: choice-of-anchor D domain-containing protein, partial [Phycisphaerae bacterium]|nr:choice-of-anchor D domain-containing protein [Phycisphaerae bacterium]
QAGSEYTATFYVRNDSSNGVPLVITNVRLAPLGDANVSVALDTSVPVSRNYANHVVLNPGQYARYIVTWTVPYDTAALGPMDPTTVLIETNAVNSSPHSLTLQGQAEGSASVTVLGSPLDFGEVVKGTTGEVTFSIRNDGLEPLHITSMALDDPTGFVISYPPGWPFDLAWGEEAEFTLRFSPTATGDFDTILRIATNDGTHGVSVYAQAIVIPDIKVEHQGSELTSGSSTIHAPVTEAGQTWSSLLRITNVDERELVIDSWSIVPGLTTPAGTFSIDPVAAYAGPDGKIHLAQNAFIDVQITFAPGILGQFEGTLSIQSDDPDENPFTIDLAGEGIAAVIHADTSSHDFGNLQVGQTQSVFVTISNQGQVNLVLSEWSVTNPSVFSVSPTNPAGIDGDVVLAPGASTTIEVFFTPGAVLDYAGTLSIVSNDPSTPTLEIALEGRGVAGAITVLESTGTVNDDKVEFGNVELDESASVPLVLRNTGEGVLTITSWSSSHAGVFVISPENPTGSVGDIVLAPGQSVSLLVSFSPAVVGETQAVLSFFSDDPSIGEKLVTVTGRGVVGEIEVLEESGTVNDDLLAFGNVKTGQTGIADVTILNVGQGTLRLFSWSSDNPAFTLHPSSLPSFLAPGGSVSLKVVFAPTDDQFHVGTITIQTNDAGSPSYVLTATGTGVAGDIEVTEDSGVAADDDLIEFGDVRVGQTRAQTFTIRNTGVANLIVTDWQIVYAGSSEDLAQYTTDLPGVGGSFILAPGEQRDVKVTFAPTMAGTRDATLRIISDDPNESPYEIDLTARGVEPNIVVLRSGGQQVSTINFGDVKTGTSSDIVVTIRNAGAVALDVSNWSSTNGRFTLVPSKPTGLTLAPGAETQLTVRFTPTEPTEDTGQIRISSNDPDHPVYAFSVTGTGMAPAITVTESAGTANDDRVPFGDVAVGETAYSPVVVHNTGNAPLVLSKYTSSNQSFVVLPANGSSSGDNVTLQPGESVTLNIVFSPEWLVTESGVITIMSDAPNQPWYEIDVDGRGTPEPLPSDFDLSGQTDIVDFRMLEVAFGTKSGQAGYDPMYDLAGPNGVVNFADVAVFADYYGQVNRSPSKAIVMSSVNSPTGGGSLTTESSWTFAATTSSGKTSASAKMVSGESSSDGDATLMANLGAAFDSGALAEWQAVSSMPASEAEAPEPGLGSSDGVGSRLDAAITPAATSGSGLTETGGDLSSGSFTIVLGGDTTTENVPSLDDLGELEGLVAPYAEALLPG